MQRISRQQFVDRFHVAVPVWKLTGIEPGPLTLDSDAEVTGILEGDLIVRPGANVLVHGIVEGDVMVEAGAVLYADGIIDGDLRVDGAACVEGIVNGRLHAAESAVIALDALVGNEDYSAA